MAQYAVLVFEPHGGSADPGPEVIQAYEDLPERIAAQGGRIVAGLAMKPVDHATTIRGGEIVRGPFAEGGATSLAAVFVVEANDLAHAVALAKLTPVTRGGVEVRPLLAFEIIQSG
ncbi:hypothetical protein Acor_01790 [Acrocarpospora corrugata]|uniref:YCII-related domain-containing protein n=1 Tax=Acrocarpospora corrugata TaxID=35763 RepID=A0A5M3VUR6_9ACTN|nr:YciI family protein [Acrocarpospora corrugata]GER98117.1 hypothetical protein Acor_01790 [Acrocarpospora corrugata]